ncbi:nuclear transport factor 2 family protein [Candidatus Amarobacter glycogenicus]|uniref:nuclear transport factor 2 family protein n=1 Tax=Candidatus Amarobacter glycogenicus TaxID=3140699 RepID=UPI003135408C|nr:nuclear transport factor 2 family protein [Dehalococcoidia bacterium]
MTPNDNIATIRAALAAFNANDVAALERLVDPDFVYIVRGHSSLSGEYRGWDAWAKGLARIKELTAGSMAATPSGPGRRIEGTPRSRSSGRSHMTPKRSMSRRRRPRDDVRTSAGAHGQRPDGGPGHDDSHQASRRVATT